MWVETPLLVACFGILGILGLLPVSTEISLFALGLGGLIWVLQRKGRFVSRLRLLGAKVAGCLIDENCRYIRVPQSVAGGSIAFLAVEDSVKQPESRPSASREGKDPPVWFHDLDIFQLQVRTFYDSNADGIGDLAGLTEKLGYIRDLGVGAIWLLPIFPSPMRDGGYDITDYKNIHPDIGTMSDFKKLLVESHRMGLRVLLDLVVNHTSDQHPWFQSARRGPDHPYHDYYVWNPTPDRYAAARVIFTDTEKSNWTLDPGCGLYYWHRFFSHQPDLNYDNPAVAEEMLAIVRFWLDLGVDGFRVDAAPYLFEREGTSCENLPETHAFLKRLRTVTNEYSPPRVLLAEANQHPKDLASYFGSDDELHMALHFPLMPRLFMALHSEDSRPIIDILKATPEPPGNCQWAMFLRNHDELTLEMVSSEEREYMLAAFASAPEMRLNVGIRRRLWPLLMGGRRQIELLHGLILGLPGCAVFYYGDEIGMGDNIHLGDRKGVRTPMQWSPDRNAGFSRADASQLEAPIITTPEYHFAGHNVESLDKLPTSFLNWFRRMVKTHGEVVAFRGSKLQILAVDNPRILAFMRGDGGVPVLCVYNLSRFVQTVHVEISRWTGLVPVEVTGHCAFPRIDDSPYSLAMGPHSFYWLRLERRAAPEPEYRRTLLFVCRFNSARSQMAETLARSMADSRVRIFSAGLTETIVNGEVIVALREAGLSTEGQYSKTLEGVSPHAVDDVIVFAEEARLPSAKLFPKARHHFWPIDDPIALADPKLVPGAVREARDLIASRLGDWMRKERLCR